MKVLFVCSGNICRSPMAAEYFRARVVRSGLSHVVVDSAGTLGIEGAPAAEPAIRVLSEIGVDLSTHRSKGIGAADVNSSDIVVVMTREHLEELAQRFPRFDQQRFLLRAFEAAPEPDPNPRDLRDPLGTPVENYREQLRILTRSLDHLALHLEHP